MTDAPKIDTQAPDTSREAVSRHIDDLWEMIPASWARQTENLFAALLAERDLADARAAAVREAAWKSGYMIGARCADKATADAAYVEYCTGFPGNPDLAAALDRLIADRVRVAEHAGWIRAAKAIKGILAIPQPGTVSEIIEDLIASKLDAARGSKEGQS